MKSDTIQVKTFVPKETIPLAKLTEIKSIRDESGTVIARAAHLYASNSDSDLRFKVIDPQGRCIIGGTEECLINESTTGKRGGLESIPYGDQILRVKYSGADNVLERFSITSVDPIEGKWSVQLESEDGLPLKAGVMYETYLKVTYRGDN